MPVRIFKSLSLCVFLAATLLSSGAPGLPPAYKLYAPALNLSGASEIGLALVNPTASAVEVVLTVRDYNGVLIRADGLSNPVRLTLPAFHQRQSKTTELFGAGIQSQAGWIEISADAPGVKGYFVASDAGGAGMDGGELAREPSSQIVFPKASLVAPAQFTFVNTSAEAVDARVSLYANNGRLVQSAAMPIAGFSGFSGGLGELWSAPSSFDGYVVITSSAGSLIGFETYRRNSDFAIVRGLPASAQTRNGYLAHFIAGGDYSTHLVLVNPTSALQRLRITAHGSGASTVIRTLPAYGRLEETVGSMFDLDKAIASDGYIEFVTESETEGVFAILDYGSANQTALAAVEAEANRYSDLVFSGFADGAGYYTGFALLNPNNQPSSVTVEVFDSEGRRTASTDVTLDAGEHQAHTVDEFLAPAAKQTAGFVHLTATRPIVAMELFGTRDALTLASAAGEGERLIPQMSGRTVHASRGANVVSTFGASLLIPPNALPADATVELTPVAVNGVTGVQLTPAGTKLQAPARLRFGLSQARTPGSNVRILMQEGPAQLGLVDATGKTVSLEVTQLTTYTAPAAGELASLANLDPADTIGGPPTDVSIEPKKAIAGAALRLQVAGTGFRPGSIVRFDRRPVPFEFIDATSLAINLSSAQLTRGFHRIEVGNSAGEFSNPVELAVTGGDAPARSILGALPNLPARAVSKAGVKPIPLPFGLIAGYNFDEGVGVSAADVSGNGLAGILVNDATWTTGKYGSAVGFAGLEDYVELRNPAALQFTGSLTISAWIKPGSFPTQDAAIVSKRGDAGWELTTTADAGPRTIGFRLTNNSGSDVIRYGATSIQTDEWQHVAGVYDGLAGILNVYLNGTLDNGALVGEVTDSQLNSEDTVNIGQRSGYPGLFNFAGAIDDVRIYSRALTATEILADLNTALVPDSDNLNQPPVVTAAADPTVILPAVATLIGTATDDGLPAPAQLTTAWSKFSGPGDVTFADPNALTTTASFSAPGSYVLRLTASDGARSASADASITVEPEPVSRVLAAGYGFNEGVGIKAADSSGNGLTGILRNNAGWAAGKHGRALFLSGHNDYVDLDNPLALRITGGITISAWINSSSFPSADAAIVSKRGAASGFELDTTLDQGVRTIALKLTSASGAAMVRYGTTPLEPNKWYYVSGVYDAAAGTVDVYLNGQSDNGVLLGPVTTAQQDSPENVNIGQRPGFPGVFNFAGILDDVRIYARPLTQADILADMTIPLGPRIDPTANQPPQVTAGPAKTIALFTPPATAMLGGAASDDGLPIGNGLVIGWSTVSGPGTVVFSDPTSLHSTAGFSALGDYVLRLTASDGVFTSSDDIAITVVTGPIVAGYGFNEGRGTTANDASDNRLTASLNEGAKWAVGKYGNGLRLDGDLSYVNLGNPTSLQITSSMTISAWINPSSFAMDDSAIVSKRGTIGGYQLDTTADQGYRTTGFKLTNSFGQDMIRYGATELQPDAWHHVAGVYDAAAGTIDIYLDGQLDNGELHGVITNTQQDSTEDVNIGQRPGQLGAYNFAGVVDDVRIYVRALTQAEIQEDMMTSLGDLTDRNQRPVVNAGGAQIVTLPAAVTVTGSVSDDGLPANSQLTSVWTLVSGPGIVTFGDVNSPATTAVFSTPGSYVLRLIADDSALIGESDVVITVNPAVNQPPVVSAGPDQTIILTDLATLTGAASDDGLPEDGALTTTWSKVSGPGTVMFGLTSALVTTASFSTPGVYVLRLSASDSVLAASANVTITVNLPPPPVLTAIYPSSGVQGAATFSAILTGANLLGATDVAFSGTGITASLNSVTNTSISLSINISAGAPTGARTVTVTLPEGRSAALTNGFTVNSATVPVELLSASRRTDWSQAGVQEGIPARNTVCATFNPGATAEVINLAIAGCPDGQVVELGAGTFNLSSTINISRNNVTLRGQGMSTILNFTGVGDSGYLWGTALIAIQDREFSLSGYHYGDSAGAPALTGVPPWTVHAWTGTNGQTGVYTQGATVLTLDSAPIGLQVGDTLTLWQLDAPDNTVPNNGYFVSAKAGADGSNVSWQGSTETNNSGQQQRVKVVAINGAQVAISPGLYRPTGTWSTALGPKVGWQSTIRGVGLEDFRVAKSFTGKIVQLIGFAGAADSWVTGLGLAGGNVGGDYGIYVVDSRNLTVRNSWWDPFIGGGVYTTTSYGVMLHQASGCLIENNIFNGVESPVILASGSTGNVISYNFENYTQGTAGGLQLHEEGPAMNLFEGNHSMKVWADVFHGNTALNTIFRNHFYSGDVGVDLWSYHRWYNVIGNVVNADIYKSIYSDPTPYDRWYGVAFRLGYASQNANGGVELADVYPDPIVAASTMIWGNWVTGVGDSTWNPAEVPSSDPVFPNPIPTDQTLPASLYLASSPVWWPSTKPWPLIGPDVSGGNAAGYDGHAYTLPAEDCYNSIGSLANFDPSRCYGSASIYYVDQSSGDDGNSGKSPATPWKNAPGMAACSLQCASTTVPPGSTIYLDRNDTWLVSGGEYGLHVKAGVTYIGDVWPQSAIGARATIKASGNLATAVIDIREDDSVYPTVVQGIDVDGNGQVTDGIGINHPLSTGPLTGAVKRVENVIVHDTGSQAAADPSTYGIVVGNAGGAVGRVENVEILNSVVHDTSRDGIALYPGDDSEGARIQNITVRGNEVYNTGKDPAYGAGSGILTRGHVQDAFIEYNYVHNTKGAGFLVMGNDRNHYGVGPANIHIRYNIATNNTAHGALRIDDGPTGGDPKDIKIYGNIIYQSTPGGGLVTGAGLGSTNSLLVYNNTFYEAPVQINNSSATFSVFEFKNNIVYTTGVTAIAGSTAFTAESNNLTIDPIFRNTANLPTGFVGVFGVDMKPNADGLNLQSTSPAIDAGTPSLFPGSINSLIRPQAGAWDIGAYEAGAN